MFLGKHVSENLEATYMLQWKHLTKNAVIIDKLKRSKSKKKKNLRQPTSSSDKKKFAKEVKSQILKMKFQKAGESNSSHLSSMKSLFVPNAEQGGSSGLQCKTSVIVSLEKQRN